jgi:hypothetical protein
MRRFAVLTAALAATLTIVASVKKNATFNYACQFTVVP